MPTTSLAGYDEFVGAARQEAISYGHRYIGQEHFLLAFLQQEDGQAARVMKNLGFEARSAVRSLLAPEDFSGRNPLRDADPASDAFVTPRARKALDLALEEAKRTQASALTSEHVLLGILLAGEGLGFDLLDSRGIRPEAVRKELSRMERSR